MTDQETAFQLRDQALADLEAEQAAEALRQAEAARQALIPVTGDNILGPND